MPLFFGACLTSAGSSFAITDLPPGNQYVTNLVMHSLTSDPTKRRQIILERAQGQ
jgi:hypothetical protein